MAKFRNGVVGLPGSTIPGLRTSRTFHVYIMSSVGGVLYTGVTNNLPRRVAQHKSEDNPGFTGLYRAYRLFYCEKFTSIRDAIEQEKRIKSWTRHKRLALIRTTNPKFKDLSDESPD